MASLLSSFLSPPNPSLRNVSSLLLSTNNSSMKSHNPTIIVSKSSFTRFHRHKKTLNGQKTLDQTIKNQQSPKKSLLPTILNGLDGFVCDFIDSGPLPSYVDPKLVLSGNSAPVAELPPTACDPVEGTLPSCLDGGAYISNGPNPNFMPRGPYHLLDGDGMLHVIKFSKGNATFCCRYVKTHKHTVESEMGYPFVPSIFSSFNGGLLASVSRILLTVTRVLAGQFDPINLGFGTANTSLAVFSGHLFALCESDLPYAINVTAEGDIETLGRYAFGGDPVKFSRMTAHPKVDGVTGEAFSYMYDMAPPFLTYFTIDSNGRKRKSVPIFSIAKVMVIHDFAVTEKFAVIPDLQIVVKPAGVLGGRSPVGVDRKKVARVGIIPKYAEEEGEMVWVEAAGFNPLHCVNAWEEDGGDTVCMVASNAVALERLMEDIGGAQLTMEKIVVNVKEKRVVERHKLSPEFLEFGVINPAYASQKNRYMYALILGEKQSVGVVKLDLSLAGSGDCTVACRRFELGCHGGEPFFVAREPNNPAAEEDDGYLVAYFYDGSAQESRFVIMDTKSPTLEIIAAVKLPQRVPIGFHGRFLSETDLSNLKTSI